MAVKHYDIPLIEWIILEALGFAGADAGADGHDGPRASQASEFGNSIAHTRICQSHNGILIATCSRALNFSAFSK